MNINNFIFLFQISNGDFVSPPNNVTSCEKNSQNFGHLLDFMECSEDHQEITKLDVDFTFFNGKTDIIQVSDNQVIFGFLIIGNFHF